MIKKLIISSLIVLSLGAAYASEETGIFTGTMRVLPYDSAFGNRDITTFAGANSSYKTGRYVGTVIDYVRLSIRSKLSEVVSIQADPVFSATGLNSTPIFGKNVGEQVANGKLFDSQTFDVAKVIFTLQDGYKVSTGLFRAKLTWDYGNYMAEKNSIMESMFSKATDLGNILDSGVEINKTFSVSNLTLPVTLQLLNGANPYYDQNQNIAWLVKVEPELSGIKLNLALFNNLTTNNSRDLRTAVGAEYTSGPLYLRGEFAASWQKQARQQQNGSTSASAFTKDTKKATGYYALVKYAALSNVNVQAQYSVLELNNLAGVAYGSNAKELDSDLAFTAEYVYSPDFVLNATYTLSNYSRKDSDAKAGNSSEVLDFNRFIIGSRISF